MKKILASILSVIITASAYAEWKVQFDAGLFYYEDGTPIEEGLNFALIVDMNDKGFSSFELTEGDIFVSNTFINSQSDYKTLVTGNLKDPYGFNEWMATSTSEWRFENEDYGFIGGEEVAIVVWDSDSITMSADDSYVLATPSLAGGELSGGVEWLVPTGISAINVQWSFATTDNFGTIDPSFATLSSKVTAVPEPSAYATLFGLTALCAIFVRCKK